MKKLFGIVFVALLATTGSFALAQNSNVSSGDTINKSSGVSGGNQLVNTQITNPIKYDNFYDFVEAVLKVAVQILMPFVILAFVWSGFLFVRAQGAPAELESAKKAILWSVIGAFILLGAWAFARIIGTTVTALTS